MVKALAMAWELDQEQPFSQRAHACKDHYQQTWKEELQLGLELSSSEQER